MPPAPRGDWMSYGPSFVPVASPITGVNYSPCSFARTHPTFGLERSTGEISASFSKATAIRPSLLMTSKQKTSNPDTFAHGPLLKRIKADLYHKKKRGGSLHPACHEMLRLGLNQSLVQHGIGDLQEAADVGAVHQIARGAVGFGSLEAGLVDGDHDFVQPIVHFLAGPVHPSADMIYPDVGGGHAARVRSLGRPIEDFGLQEQLGGVERAGHVRAFGNDLDPVVDEVGRVLGVDLVLGGAGERAISFDVPQRVVAQLEVGGHEDGFLELVRILANAATLGVLQFQDPSELLVIDAVGINHEKLAWILELKNTKRGRIREYADQFKKAIFMPTDLKLGYNPLWNIKADCAFPSATQNEINAKDATNLINNGVKVVAEGANMPSTLEATKLFLEAKVLYGPAKAANAGGVATSGLEMSQNSARLNWTREEVDDRLHKIMIAIHKTCFETAETYGTPGNLVNGANIGGFLKVANAMLDQGLV